MAAFKILGVTFNLIKLNSSYPKSYLKSAQSLIIRLRETSLIVRATISQFSINSHTLTLMSVQLNLV